MMNPQGANVIYDASSFSVNHQQLDHYFKKVENRFPNLVKQFMQAVINPFLISPPILNLSSARIPKRPTSSLPGRRSGLKVYARFWRDYRRSGN